MPPAGVLRYTSSLRVGGCSWAGRPPCCGQVQPSTGDQDGQAETVLARQQHGALQVTASQPHGPGSCQPVTQWPHCSHFKYGLARGM
ncbi:hypothetical protein DI272_19115 [Streptomyces sp. Act143]|nr:hypothetical protein DI272_19115 [Streptomyces sp. Act143]